MTIRTDTVLSLGKLRKITWDDAVDPHGSLEDGRTPLAAVPALTTRQITEPELWADTSETLTTADYQYMATTLGMRGCFRYVPLAGGGGGITTTELAAALSVKCPDGTPFSLGFVQFARSNGISGATGSQDGAAAATYLKDLGVPSTVFCAMDLDVNASVANCTAYANDSFAAMTGTYLAQTAVAMYAEPGYPLSAAQRYGLSMHRYWATAANDPNKWVSSRGCQVVQLWGSTKGEYFPRPGLVIDADAVQADYFGSFPVVLCAAGTAA